MLPRTALLAGLVVAMALVWFLLLALLVDRLGRWLRRPRAARWVTAFTGVALWSRGGALVVETVLG